MDGILGQAMLPAPGFGGMGIPSLSFLLSAPFANGPRPMGAPMPATLVAMARELIGVMEQIEHSWGGTRIAEKDAIPGTRFATIQDPTQWHSATARSYAWQFAAYAADQNPLTADGMAAGGAAMQNMSEPSRLFMNVASVYKGNLLDG